MMPDDRLTEELAGVLRRALRFVEAVASSRKGSIGAMDNVYLPQMDRREADELADALRAAIAAGKEEG